VVGTLTSGCLSTHAAWPLLRACGGIQGHFSGNILQNAYKRKHWCFATHKEATITRRNRIQFSLSWVGLTR